MPSASNGIIYYEAGQTLVPMAPLTDSGDHLKFNTASQLISDKSGYNPDVKANGVLTGLEVNPAASLTDDMVDVSGGTLNLNGVVVTVPADTDLACLRGATTNVFRTNSIVVEAAGTLAVISGTAHTTESEVRGALGGPPVIAVDAVEIAQVRFTGITAAVVLASEIKSIPNTHRELATYPTFDVDFFRATSGVLGSSGVLFSSAPMLNHTGGVAKRVYAKYYTPAFAAVAKSSDFKRPAQSVTISSIQIYGGAIGAVGVSLGAGGFKAYLQNGVTDGILAEEGKKLWFKFHPDRLQAPYILTQGYLGIAETFPAGSAIVADCVISAEMAGDRVSS